MKTAAGIFLFLLLSIQICNGQEYQGAYWDFYFYHTPSTASEATGKIYLNSNNDGFSSFYNPALPSYSDNLKISFSNSQKAFIHENTFYNAFGIDVPVKNVGTFSFLRNYNHIIDFDYFFPEDHLKYYTSYIFNYSKEVFNGFHAGVGFNYFKWESLSSSRYINPRYFSEYYSLNLGISYNYTLPESEYYSHSAFINMSVLNILTSHPKPKKDLSDPGFPLPQIDRVSLGYKSKYKGFGILKGMDDFQTNIQVESFDLLNSYYYSSYCVGADIKFIEIISLKVGNYIFAADYMTFGIGLSFPLKLVSEIPLVIDIDYSQLKAPVFYNDINKKFDSFSATLRYDIP
jgi:hypothetical protein